MKTSFTSRTVTLLILLALACLPGCTNFLAFSDSAAMRIEVEVYKGPLSLEPEMQLGELYGYIFETRRGLQNTQEFIRRVSHLHNSSNTKSPSVPVKQSDMCRSKDMGDQVNCSILTALDDHTTVFVGSLDSLACKLIGDSVCGTAESALSKSIDAGLTASSTSKTSTEQMNVFNKDIETKLDTLNMASIRALTQSQSISITTKKESLREVFLAANQIAAAMQAAAFRYATASTAGQSNDFTVRIALTYFIVATSEYGNQIQARSDALFKQLKDNGRDRRELPLSAHLRESEPTDFLHLFDWMNAHVPFSSVEERVKIMDRLYADHFWSKNNTVYASGRGKTQIAFIKDETGNWNLKSFDNDPTELLDAYTKAAKAALDGLVKVTEGLASGGTSLAGKELANQLLAIADQTAPDKPQPVAAPAGTLSLTHLQNRLLSKLDPEVLKNDLDEDVAQQNAVNTESDPGEKKKKQALLAQHRDTVINKWKSQIDDHSNLVDILSSTVKKK